MSRNTRLLLMFLPLLLGFALTFLVAYDIKHPLSVTRDNCQVVATGPAASNLRTTDNVLYAHGSASVHDIGLRCKQWGIVVVNDSEPYKDLIFTSVEADITRIAHRWWPVTWRFNVHQPKDILRDGKTLPEDAPINNPVLR